MRDDLLTWLCCVELKSPQRRELWDDLKHQIYRDESILRTKSDFSVDRTDFEGYRVTESPSYMDPWCHPVRINFLPLHVATTQSL